MWLGEASNLNDVKTLLNMTHDTYKISLTDCKQSWLNNNDILLNVTGTLYTPNFANEKEFEQEVILSPGRNGYYISRETFTLLLPPPSWMD
eukprot:g7540.t1